MKTFISFLVLWAIALRLFGQSSAPQNPAAIAPAFTDVESAQREAEKRHPQLADKKSTFSQMFSNDVERLKRENAQVFDSLTWPLLLSERLDRKLKSAPGLTAGELSTLITIPNFDVKNISTREALKSLATQSKELDPDKRGVTIILDQGADVPTNVLMNSPNAQITAALKDKSLLACIRLVAGLSNLIVTSRPDTIYVHSRTTQVPTENDPQKAKQIPVQSTKSTPIPAPTQNADHSAVPLSDDEVAQALMFWGNEFHRWDKNPKISIHATPEIVEKFRDSLAAGITQLNSILIGSPVQLEMLDGNMAAADICVYIDRIDNLQRIWRKNGASPLKIDLEGRMEGQWETTGALKRVGIYVPIESLSVVPPRIQSRHLLSQLSHAVGIGSYPRANIFNTSRILLQNFVNNPRSERYSSYDASLFVFTNAEKLIIRFAYQFAPVQADKTTLRALVRKKWPEVKPPLAQ